MYSVQTRRKSTGLTIHITVYHFQVKCGTECDNMLYFENILVKYM